AVRVAELVEAIDQLLFGHRLAAPEFERTRQHTGKHGRAFAVQPSVDQPGEADVVITGGNDDENRRNREHCSGDTHPALPPDADDPYSVPCGPRSRVGQPRPLSPAYRSLDGDNPMPPEIERKLLIQAIDQRWTVFIQEGQEADASFLGVTAGEGERPGVDE